jgi:hypothetical protein
VIAVEGAPRLWSDIKAWAHDHEPLFGILASMIIITGALGWWARKR